ADVRKRAEPVDAGVRPEVDEDDLPAEVGGRERRRVEPPRGAIDRRHVRVSDRAHLVPPSDLNAEYMAPSTSIIAAATEPYFRMRASIGSRSGQRVRPRASGRSLEVRPGEPLEPAGEVPVPVAEQLHGGGEEDSADDGRVDEDGRREAHSGLFDVELAERA